MRSFLIPLLLTSFSTIAVNGVEKPADVTTLEKELMATETSFSKSAEDRDLKAFRSFLTPETVFSTPHGNLRGPDAIVEQWAGFFAEGGPSIRWQPSRAAVLEDGTTGMTTGPFWVEGKTAEGGMSQFTGTFFSVWHRDDGGRWRIVLDTGTEAVPLETATEE